MIQITAPDYILGQIKEKSKLCTEKEENMKVLEKK